MCGGTGCSNASLQTKLLEWVLSGIFVATLRSITSASMTREAVKSTMCDLLFKRKVIMYLTAKFKFRDEEDKVYMQGKSPTEVHHVFTSFLEFHKAFPKGTPVPTYEDDAAESTSSNVWLGMLSELQQQVEAFKRDLLDCRPKIQTIIKSFLMMVPNATAEAFFDREDVKKIIDVEDTASKLDKLYQPLAPVVAPVVAALAEPPAPAKPPAEDLEVVEGESNIPREDSDSRTNTERHFAVLSLSACLTDKFNAVPPDAFDEMMRAGKQRHDTYVELRLRPDDPSQWPHAVMTSTVLRTAGPQDRTMFTTDPKNMDGGRSKPGSRLPAIRFGDLEEQLHCLFGDPAKKPEERAKKKAFNVASSNDMFLAFDARNHGKFAKVLTAVKKMVKDLEGFYQKCPYALFRLSHTNAEFAAGAPLASKHAGSTFRFLPDPVETITMVFSKSFKLTPTARLHLDLPGDNHCKGINSVPLLPGVGDGRRPELPPSLSNDLRAEMLKELVVADAGEEVRSFLVVVCCRCGWCCSYCGSFQKQLLAQHC